MATNVALDPVLVELMGTLEWDSTFNRRAERSRY